MLKRLNNSKGFSLIELMVVVAIMAILASFAIPQYQTFQSKARQKEGVSLISSFFAAAAATQAELGFYPGNLVANGFNPTGALHYRISTADNATVMPGGHPNNDTCLNTVDNCGNWGGWTEVTTGAFAAAAPNGCAAAVTDTTFLTCASGNIRAAAGADTDTWSINERKTLTNTNGGIDPP